MCSISVVVVVYNKRIDESAALASLTGIEGLTVYVADNSTRDMGNEALAVKAGYTYINMGGNAGLSKAYNKVIGRIEKDDGFVCLFDDDTAISPAYFDALRADAEKNGGINLFVPIVKDASGMLSPCVFKGMRGRRAASAADIPPKSFTAINSGLAIRTRVFKDYRYDESLFLDYIDHAFIRDIVEHDKSKVRIMEVSIQQQFSGSERQSRQDALTRYAIFAKDVRYFGRKYGEPRLRVWLLLIRRRLKLLL